MPVRKKSVRKIKKVLRLRSELGLGQRQIARSCTMGLGTVHDYLERAAAAGISWPLPARLSEDELEAKLVGEQPVTVKAAPSRPQLDWIAVHEQLQQHTPGQESRGILPNQVVCPPQSKQPKPALISRATS